MQGLGITMFGMAYMFVHDGLVHKRFPVGPIAEVPYLQKVAAAHQVWLCKYVYWSSCIIVAIYIEYDVVDWFEIHFVMRVKTARN